MTTRAQRKVVLTSDPTLAPTVEMRAVMSETDWNWHFRQALRKQGFRALHFREADETGIADLLVYRMRGPGGTKPCAGCESCLQVVEGWIELKVIRYGQTWRDTIRPSQTEFMRDHWRFGRNAFFVFYNRRTDVFEYRQGDLKGRLRMTKADPYAIQWQEVFARYKAQRVSLA